MTSSPGLELRQVRRRLDPPQRNANALWIERVSIEVALDASGGARGWGEAAPLPDYSHDSPSQAERALGALPAARLRALAEVDDPRALLDAAASLIPEEQPSARFALETALLDRAARRRGQPLWQLLAEVAADSGEDPRPLPRLYPSQPVALCALLPSDDPGAALALARAHVAAGVTTFKLKVGPERLAPEQEATLSGLRRELGTTVGLRADANGSLQPDHLRSALDRLARLGVEFLEEPSRLAELERLGDSPCPLALDESLQRMSASALARWLGLPALRVLVLKPTALGGFGACLRLARAARARGRDVVVSHTFEGPIAWAACAHLALALGGTLAAGLAPLAHQAADEPRIVQGWLVPAGEPGPGRAP